MYLMMEKLHKEPDANRQDYHAFVNELKLFHQNRGTPFRHVPRINGREIDLQKFYNHVTALGGLQSVIDHRKWDSVAEVLNIPKACVNSSLTLRQIYIRYLGHYEKIHFMDEEIDHDKNQPSESHSRKSQIALFQTVPMVYNSLQHDIADNIRANIGLNQVFVAPTDYDKLCMSLLCGLPNEQELALNVCTILSNEGNYMLHLEQTPKLVDLLVAQTGVWPQDNDSLRSLYLESWKDVKGRNMSWFWQSTLDLQNPLLTQLLGYDLDEYDEDAEFLHLRADLGSINAEGQRVLRVALILHNLSFEQNNIPVLVSNHTFIRFLLLCIHSSWANLSQTAYDTLGNLASEMKLSIEKDVCSRVIFQSVMKGVQSSDRFMNIRSMDILSQLCNCEPNDDIPTRLDVEIYHRMVSFLTIHDIMLLFYTLEALYSLSELGRYACDKIVCVHRSVSALVSLLTLEPSQYGPSGQMNMKIVETLVPVESDGEQEDKPVTTSDERSTSSPALSGSGEIDSETFASNWLRSSYESCPGAMVSRNDIYADYVNCCSRAGRKGVVNANVFANCVKNVFPMCGLKKLESGAGVISFCHDGLRKKKIMTTQTGPPVAKPNNGTNLLRKPTVMSPLTPCKPTPKPRNSPILKAQLSAPPRSGVASPPLKPNVQVSSNDGISISSVSIAAPSPIMTPSLAPATPTTTGSTLIKSLLANKVQQRNLQRQVVPQNVSKMVIYTPEKVTSIGPNLAGSPTTVVRYVRPAAFAPTNINAQIRTPVQARIMPNKGRVIASAPPRVIKTTVLPPKIQPKVMKPAVITNAIGSPRLNGVQRDVQVEVCTQSDDSSNSTSGNKMIQLDQVKAFQNHLPANIFSDSNDSFMSDGDLQLAKDVNINSESEKSILQSSSGSNELSTSSGNFVIVQPKPSNDGLSILKEQNSSVIAPLNSSTITSFPLVGQPKVMTSPSSILKSVLGELEVKNEDLNKQQLQRDRISKRAPLLNGLLDSGKLPLPGEIPSCSEVRNEENKASTSVIQSTLNSAITPVTSLATFIPSSSLSIVIPASSLNSVIIPASSLNSAILNASSLNSAIISGSSLNSAIIPASPLNPVMQVSTLNVQDAALTTQAVPAPAQTSAVNCSISTVIPTATFHSSGDNLMQICTEQTTLSGTVEMQPDQKGVVRLHIESPENSNQGSDLSSISEITQTLEFASKAISKTNAECNSQIPTTTTCETTATMSVITTNTTTLAQTGQQIIVFTPALNQPQLHLQSPNIKFRILQTIPKVEESVELIGLPRVSLNQINQLRQPAPESPSVTLSSLKRTSTITQTTCSAPDNKKPRIDTKTPLLEATLRLPAPVPSSISSTSVGTKSFQENQSFLIKSSHIETIGSTPKLTTAKAVAVPVQNVDLPTEKEGKTFSGLSTAGENPTITSPPLVSPSCASSSKLEYLCEWKDCGQKFQNPGSVFLHASKVHTPLCDDDMICQWEGCDNMKRRRFSLLTHLQDWHCNERALHTQALRRKQLSQQGKTSLAPPQMPPPHPGYVADAALLAIRRHGLQYINPKELSEEKESALTKSIRLTSALILRNLVTHSSLARSHIRRFEPELAYLAMSPVESSRTIAQCLSQLSRPHD